MGRSLIIYAAAGLLLLPFAAGAADYGQQEALAKDIPPVAQPLVREGDFAVKLAALYGLGVPSNETEAEDLLAAAGIVPLNGWISDYPVTPEILGQIQEAAARSATEGRLPMTAEKATRLIADLAAEMSLPLPVGAAPEQQAPVRPYEPYEQTVVNNYYAGYGPPIITYYPPPLSYLYLYAWVPYPIWWYGYWYPGFYISHNFSTTIVVGTRTVFVRNRFMDPLTRQVVRVDPVVRTRGDGVRSLTTLRTDDGRTFRNIRELRQGAGAVRTPNERDGTLSRRPPGAGGFRSFEDRKSAGDIQRKSMERQGTGRSGRSEVRDDEKRKGGPYSSPPRNGRRSYESYDRRSAGDGKFPGAPPQGRTLTPPPRMEKQFPGRPGQGSKEVRPGGPGPASEQHSFGKPLQGGRWIDNPETLAAALRQRDVHAPWPPGDELPRHGAGRR